jgi:hypothetical protein
LYQGIAHFLHFWKPLTGYLHEENVFDNVLSDTEKTQLPSKKLESES